jgi:hypothetical protein
MGLSFQKDSIEFTEKVGITNSNPSLMNWWLTQISDQVRTTSKEPTGVSVASEITLTFSGYLPRSGPRAIR